MNPALLKAAKEISERSGKDFNEILQNLKVVWTSLTGQKVYTAIGEAAVTAPSQYDLDESIESFSTSD